MLGVLGGMGPLATADFMIKLARNTPAERDQEHLDVLVCSAASIPDRTAAIIGGGPDPFPAMQRALRRLESAGASLIAIPCNTAHHWHAALQATTSLPILHIADALVHELAEANPRPCAIGVLASEGALQTRIYQDRLTAQGFACVLPDRSGQAEVTQAIRLVKAGEVPQARIRLRRQAAALLAGGAAKVVMACTEIPLALADEQEELKGLLLDPTDALARTCVDIARQRMGLPGPQLPEPLRGRGASR